MGFAFFRVFWKEVVQGEKTYFAKMVFSPCIIFT